MPAGASSLAWSIPQKISPGKVLEASLSGALTFQPIEKDDCTPDDTDVAASDSIRDERESNPPGSWLNESRLASPDWSDPFLWQAFDFAKVFLSF